MIILGYKPIGWTMLDLVKNYQKDYPNNKISFAGRLDPMASGVVKILIGNDDIQKNLSESEGNKVYTFDFIHSFTTDSYDILGIPKQYNFFNPINIGEYIQEYPPYSSVIIKEHKLPYWQVTKRGLYVNEKPTKKITISSFEKMSEKLISKNEFIDIIENQFNLLTKDTFRQKEILEKWKEHEFDNVKITTFTVTVSSGGYIRWIANKMGGCAMNIHRVKYLSN
jgi:tRNA U55 pseudouridine synthase TruB